MKAYSLPNIRPTSRRFQQGTIPETVFEAQNGATSFVRFGNTPIKSRLSLSYQNTTENNANRLAEFYNKCIINNRAVRISSTNNAVNDMKDPDGLRMIVRGGEDGLSWLFENPPIIEAQLGGRYNVSIELIGTLIA